MELSGAKLTLETTVIATGLLLAVLYYVWRWANWQRLRESSEHNVVLGAVVFMMVIWTIRTEIQPGVVWHLSGMVTLTLMFGWSLAIVAGLLALIGITIAGLNDLAGLPLTALLHIVLPASLAMIILGLSRAWLPKHFFVFVFVNAFFASGLIVVLTVLTSTLVMVALGSLQWSDASGSYLEVLPLMLFPEAVFNGWNIAMLAALRPQWLWTFNDAEYIEGK